MQWAGLPYLKVYVIMIWASSKTKRERKTESKCFWFNDGVTVQYRVIYVYWQLEVVIPHPTIWLSLAYIIVSCPDPTLCKGKGLVNNNTILGPEIGIWTSQSDQILSKYLPQGTNHNVGCICYAIKLPWSTSDQSECRFG